MTRGPQKQFDRDQVLDLAMDHFWAHGYEGSGMTALLRSMGIGRQSLYDTFGDKRALFLEALTRYFRSQVGPVMARLRSPGSPMANLRGVFELWKTMSSRPGHNGCMVGNSLAEFGRDDEEVAGIIRGYFETLEDAFCETFERARDAGELGTALPPRELARMFVATGQGLALMSKLAPDTSELERVFDTLLAIAERPSAG